MGNQGGDRDGGDFGVMAGGAWQWREWADPTLTLPHRPPAASCQEGDAVQAGLRLARDRAQVALDLGRDPWRHLQLLATLGAGDLTLARAAEPHLDAVATLAQAGLSPRDVGAGPDSTWGVFAARAPGKVLTASRDGDGWRLDGLKPWCSLADRLDHALVTAGAPDGYRLFAVDLRQPGIGVDAADWQPRGLVDITTSTLSFDGVPAREVGGPGWYLQRPGFAWGGIGVAAVWFGGAAAVTGQLLVAAARREPDQVALVHLGACDRSLSASLAVLRDAARRIQQAPEAADEQSSQLALRVRSVVAATVEEVLQQVGQATGPAPLAMDPRHTARVADLTLYVRQHHALRDLASLGATLLPR